MTNTLIKICGVRDPEMAKQASLAGAHLIGIVFHPSSPRCVNLEQATAIAAATLQAGGLPVAVFVDQCAKEMLHICLTTHISRVQLHGIVARADHHLLPKEYQRIYAQSISQQGVLQKDQGLAHLNQQRDMILIDHDQPGQGKSIYQQTFHYDLPFPWILAGGLSAANVGVAINKLNPEGVDVSSGVESSKGNKNLALIQTFIASVRVAHHVA